MKSVAFKNVIGLDAVTTLQGASRYARSYAFLFDRDKAAGDPDEACVHVLFSALENPQLGRTVNGPGDRSHRAIVASVKRRATDDRREVT
jgi:hypothetical protein